MKQEEIMFLRVPLSFQEMPLENQYQQTTGGQALLKKTMRQTYLITHLP